MLKRADLVESLATVAIAALSGPLGVVGAAAARELVKHTKSSWAAGSHRRQLKQTVETSIDAWARGENIPADVADGGLCWAIEVIQRSGNTVELLAEVNFDSQLATDAVLTENKRSDPYWGTEAEHAVVARALGATYKVICDSLNADGGAQLAATQAARREVQELRHELQEQQGRLLGIVTKIAEKLDGVADRNDLINYLRVKVETNKLWDQSLWINDKSPSELERTLQLDAKATPQTGQEEKSAPQRCTVGKALEGTWLLAVLGGPGSGKSWLAQRCAREAAIVALEQLRDPLVDPDTVEIPILTTWAAWAGERGRGPDALAAAALPNDERLQNFVRRPCSRMFAIIDSLDEIGTTPQRANELLRSIPTTASWRVLVTSRPEAWRSAEPALPKRDDVKVGNLVDLTYPEDVRSFIKQWFKNEETTAAHLIDQLEKRPELRSTATIPLLLTFYCMLTEDTPDAPLPQQHGELYRQIIDQLLLGSWSGEGPQPDLTACKKQLQEWAWKAVKDANDEAGLGTWPDVFVTEIVQGTIARAVDHVAPEQAVPVGSRRFRKSVTRRFLHRTLLEHCVAEHIATFDVDDAIEALLSHLWFDPDWEVAAPMALAAHRKRDAVLDGLCKYHANSTSALSTTANREFDDFLLRTAAMSLPADWNSPHQRWFHRLRMNAATSNADLIAAGSAGHDSNSQMDEEVLDTDLLQLTDLTSALLSLDPTEPEQAAARQAILKALPNVSPFELWILTDELHKLDPTEPEQAAARQAILKALPDTTPFEFSSLTDELHKLDPTEPEQAAARQAILKALPNADPWQLTELIRPLQQLAPTESERAIARQAILNTLHNSESRTTYRLALGVRQLASPQDWLELLSPRAPTAFGEKLDCLDDDVSGQGDHGEKASRESD